MKIFHIKNEFISLFFITIFLLTLRWLLSYIYFPTEDILLRSINEIYDTSYFPLIKSFSLLDFSPSYNTEINDLKNVSFPIISLLPNIFFYKIFGSYSFLIIEFLSVFLFLLIFYKIFYSMKICKISSIFFSLVLFAAPFLVNQLTFLNSDLISKINLNFSTFYNLRNPRPLITNLYLFIYIYYLIKFFYLEQRSASSYLIIGLIIGLSLHSFFYFFIFEIFLLLILYLVFFKSKIYNFIKDNFMMHAMLFLIILFFSILFFLQLYFSEFDYRERMGLFNMDTDKKIVMINFLINFFKKPEFIFLLSLNIFLFLIQKNNILKIFFYFFISTIFSTIFFILFSPSSIDYYHFFNWILASGTIYFIITLLFIIEKNLFLLFSKNKKKIVIIFSIIIIILNYNLSLNTDIDPNKKEYRTSLNQLVMFIKNNKITSQKDNKILTLSADPFMWLLFNNYKNFSITPNSFWSSKSTSTIENELISTFKFLNLSNDDFVKFFENKKKGYRYSNNNTKIFFDRLYLANKLKTYSEISNFEFKYQSFINTTSPLYSHQSIIPNSEYQRFSNKFKKTSKNMNPTVVILDIKDSVINKHYLDTNDFCLRYSNEEYLLYISRKLLNECELVKN